MAKGINTKGPEKTKRENRDLRQLVSELEQRTAKLQAANEELQATEEELRAANEELAAAEEELRTANEELQSAVEESKKAKTYSEGILSSMVDGLGVIDLQGIVLDVNDSLLRMMGYKREELVGSHFSRILGEKDMPRFIATMSQVMSGTPLESFEMETPTKTGADLPVSVTATMLKDEQGNPGAIFAVLRDISETKRLIRELEDRNTELQASEEELRATNEELEAANEELREAQEGLIRSEKLAAVGQLASGVGHELRNPLGAIKNAVFYVKRRLAKSDLAATDPRIFEFLDIIDGEVDAANKVISDLLGFSRVAKPAVSPTAVKAIVEDALKYLQLLEDVDLIIKLNSRLPLVQVDPDQIRQVFTNIMLNAQEAMPEGGRLTIAAQAKGEFVEVKFTDTGCGIPESTMRKIFDPLFTTKAKGVGLGLSVCQSIIERHGGSIKVESDVDKGTTFSVLLPVVPD